MVDIKKYTTGFDVIFRTIRIVWDCSKYFTIARLFFIIVQAILPIIPMYLSKLLIDILASPEGKTLSDVLWIIFGFGAATLVGILISNLSTYNSQLQSEIVADHMSKIIIEKALSIDFENYDSDMYHDKFQRAMAQSGTKPLAVLNSAFSFLQSFVSLTAMGSILVLLDWWIAVLIIVVGIPVSIIRLYYIEKNINLREKQTQENRRASYYKNVLVGGDYAKEARLFNYGSKYLDKYLLMVRTLRRERRKLYWEQARTTVGIQIGEAGAMAIAIAFIANKALKKLITVGDISLFMQAYARAQGAINTILGSAITMHSHKLTLNYLYEFLDLKNEIKDPVNPINIPSTIESLSFKNVDFYYPGTKNKVLDNVNLEFKKGEITAIVGENGSGKTTIMKLMNRLYDPTIGEVCINSVSIKNYTLKQYRNKISAIFQIFSKYAFTLNENITISEVTQDEKLSKDKIQWSAEMATVDKFAQRLPQKLNTLLGRSFRGGQQLSGGQWQKVALSRAFYKDAHIYIFDEPSSHIDPISEYNIFSNLRELAKDKILILITHRIYNLKLADKIIVMDHGKVIETGKHTKLIEKNSMYKEMFDKQS